MATENITQLTPQTGSADPTSLLYAVTGVGTYSDTGLPLSVFVNNLGLTGVPTAPTATTGTNTTQIASTAFVQAQLTSTLAAYAPKASPTFTGTVIIPTVTLSGGTINGTSVGATTPSTGAFTTLTASSGLNSTAVGNTTASTGAFTTLSASSTVSGTGFSTYLASPPAIGGTTAAAGSFTTLSASSTVSGTGFSTYLASPPAIGGTTAAAGAFTTLSASGNPHFYATNASAQSIPNGAATTVTGWTTVFDTGSNFNALTGVFTAPVAGVYLVMGQLGFAATTWPTATVAKVQVFQNATGRSNAAWTNFTSATSASWTALTGYVVFAVNCAANDTISLQATQNSGAALALGGGNVFSVVRIP